VGDVMLYPEANRSLTDWRIYFRLQHITGTRTNAMNQIIPLIYHTAIYSAHVM